MAEFSEVMGQWRRMCAAFKNCDECPQYSEYQCYNSIKYVFECGNIESLERNVMTWAAEHPVVYPTWAEWLVENGAFCPFKDIKTDFTETEILCRIRDIVFKPIPADIAEKLGIEPKEGDHGT